MANLYARIRREFGSDQAGAKRCAERLLAIKDRLAPIAARKNDGTLLLATWNIRDFDSNKFGFGPRRTESFYYIAEIIAHFDLVAVQEVARDLSALRRVLAILGREWDYIATDTTEGAGGNGERMAFLFNTEKVWFRKIAGEIVLPDGQQIIARKKVKKTGDQPVPVAAADPAAPATAAAFEDKQLQFARSPFLVAFQSGWFHFSLCTAHLYYGAASGPALDRRIAEIRGLVKFFAERQDTASTQERDSLGAVENYIVLGDFNVVSPEHKTMQALTSNGFIVPAAIDGKKVRKLGDHFYDQIAVRVKDDRFDVRGGGIVHVFDDVFTDDDLALYQPFLPAKDPEASAGDERGAGAGNGAATPEQIYRKWRTWQMSDHHPLWIEIATDFSKQYLKAIADGVPDKPITP